jgi:acetyltransferase-like isoleucine patch superfamily enzyme
VNSVFRGWDRVLSLWSIVLGRMRACLVAVRGARVGAKVSVGPRCIVDRPWCVDLGDRVLIEADVYLKVVADEASLKLGDHVFVGRGVEFDIMSSVSVGSHSLIAPRCFITDHVHGISPDLRIDQQPCRAEAVVIGSDVWLGAGTVVLPGVKIGDGAVVGASSVVTADVAPYTVVAGTPARFLRNRTA